MSVDSGGESASQGQPQELNSQWFSADLYLLTRSNTSDSSRVLSVAQGSARRRRSFAPRALSFHRALNLGHRSTFPSPPGPGFVPVKDCTDFSWSSLAMSAGRQSTSCSSRESAAAQALTSRSFPRLFPPALRRFGFFLFFAPSAPARVLELLCPRRVEATSSALSMRGSTSGAGPALDGSTCASSHHAHQLRACSASRSFSAATRST